MSNIQNFKNIINRVQAVLLNFLKQEDEIEARAKAALEQAVKKADDQKIQIVKNKIEQFKEY